METSLLVKNNINNQKINPAGIYDYTLYLHRASML